MYHLCLVTSHFYPVKSSCSDLFRDLIKSLLKENFKITIITIAGTQDKVKVINTKKLTYIGIKNNNLQSSQNYLRAMGDIISILKIRFFYKRKNFKTFDQVLVYSPSIFWGILLSKLKKKKVSIKLGDLYPKWLVDHGIIKRLSFSFLFLKFFELLLYFQANSIYVQTKKDIEYLSRYKKVFNFNCEVIYNWINPSSFVNNRDLDSIRKRKRKYLRFMFLGVICVAQDYELLYRITKYCNDNNFKSTFFFIGSGTKKNDLIKLTSKYKNVFFFSEKHNNQIDKIIQKCDICISTLSDKFYSENFPGKILRYMINNKPILVHSPNNNFLKNLIESHSLGLYSSEEKNLYKNIKFIFANPLLLDKIGENGLKVSKKLFSSERAKKILFG